MQPASDPAPAARAPAVPDFAPTGLDVVGNSAFAAPVLDTSAARAFMVNGQVRPNKVTDPRVIAAMRSIPRERFVPPGAASLAYSDEDVPLGDGRYLMEPMVIARLVQAAAVTQGERVLVVAAGSGYGAALLAACGGQVTALEQDETLLALARAALPSISAAVTVVAGPIVAGWPSGGPYDVVLIEGAVEEIPPAIIAQVKPQGGRLLTIRVAPGQTGRGRVGQAVIGEATSLGLSLQALFDCTGPLLPAMRHVAGFVF